MLLLLPLVLKAYTTNEVAVWLLFGVVASFQVIGDMGLTQALSRSISHVRGGALLSELGSLRRQKRKVQVGPDEGALLQVLSVLRPVYLCAAVVTAVFLLAAQQAILRPAGELEHTETLYFAWYILAAATVASVWGGVYQSYLLGSEQVALLRRWEGIFSCLGIMMSATAILAGGSLALLIVIQQSWVIASVARNAWLCSRDFSFKRSRTISVNVDVLKAIWPATWRGGLGVMMSFGLIQASGLMYASLAEGAKLASYLLGLKVIQVISQTSQAPFYSKIPLMARLYAEGERQQLLQVSRRGVKLAHATFVAGFFAASLVGAPVLEWLGSETKFPDAILWGLLGLAFFLERMGAMHLQLYSLTGHIIWHIANGLTGIVMVSLGWLLYAKLGIYGFPLAMLVAYLFVYYSISFRCCYAEYGGAGVRFDLKVFLGLIFLAILYCIMRI
jgi:hypothetical protein